MSQKLILYTHECAPKRGGIATYCNEFAEAAARQGYATTLIGHQYARYPEGDELNSQKPSYRVIQGKNKGTHDPSCIWKTKRLIRSQFSEAAPDALHLFAEPGPILALGLLPKSVYASSIYLTLHGSEALKWSRNPFYRRLAKAAFFRAKQINAVSEPIRAFAAKEFPEYADKFKSVPNALPETYRRRKKLTRSSERTEKLNLLSVGRLHPRKGYDHVIEALAHLPSEIRRSISYTIAGAEQDKAYYSRLITQAKEIEADLRITLNCSQNELNDQYTKADAFILTSLPYKNSVEGFGLVYLEAGSFGLPCIAYDTGGVSDAVLHEKTGLLIEQGNVAALSTAIQRFLSKPEERNRLGEANHHFATNRSWQDVVKESLDLTP